MEHLIDIAKEYAINLHNHRRYFYGFDDKGEERPYSYHLQMGVNEAEKRFHLIPNRETQIVVVCGLWCHDLQEDCGVSPNDIVKALGGGPIPVRVAQMVNDMSDVPGMDKTERSLLTYPKTRKNPDAVFGKMCDRYGNTNCSKTEGNSMWKTYQHGYPVFRYALKSKKFYDPWRTFWTELDELHEYGNDILLNKILDELKRDADAIGSLTTGHIEKIFNNHLKK
jgi:hypothetical protein